MLLSNPYLGGLGGFAEFGSTHYLVWLLPKKDRLPIVDKTNAIFLNALAIYHRLAEFGRGLRCYQ